MIKNRLIKYTAILACTLLATSLFSCVAQPIDETSTDASSTEIVQVTEQEITSNGNITGDEDSRKENDSDPVRGEDSASESGEGSETETETETEPNYGMGFIPL